MAKAPSHNTRVKRLMYNVPSERKDEATRLIEEIIWMQDELEQMRDEHAGEGATVMYDNGGGQIGERENPAYTAYQKMLKTYMQAINSLNAMREIDEADYGILEILA